MRRFACCCCRPGAALGFVQCKGTVEGAVVVLGATFVAEGSVLGAVWVLFSVDHEIQSLSFFYILYNQIQTCYLESMLA